MSIETDKLEEEIFDLKIAFLEAFNVIEKSGIGQEQIPNHLIRLDQNIRGETKN